MFSLTVVDSRAGGKQQKNKLVFSTPSSKDMTEWREAFKKVEAGADPESEEEEEEEKVELVKIDVAASELEKLEGEAFSELFGMTKEAYMAAPPFRRGQLKKKAEAKHKEKAAAANTDIEAAAAAKAAEAEKQAKAEAQKRMQVGEYIAKNGNSALLGANKSFLEKYCLEMGPMKIETKSGWESKFCAVFPSVRFPSIPANERFFFVFANEKAAKPEDVVHITPDSECNKPKSARKGHKFVFRLDAPKVLPNNKPNKKAAKFVIEAPSFEALNKWMGAMKPAAVKGGGKGEKAAAAAVGGAMSAFDFYVQIGKKKNLRLAVTGEAIQIYEGGVRTNEYPLKKFKSWSPSADAMTFTLVVRVLVGQSLHQSRPPPPRARTWVKEWGRRTLCAELACW